MLSYSVSNKSLMDILYSFHDRTGVISISLPLSDIYMFLLLLLTAIDLSIDAGNIYTRTIRSMISLLTRSSTVGVICIGFIFLLTGASHTSENFTTMHGKCSL